MLYICCIYVVYCIYYIEDNCSANKVNCSNENSNQEL